MFATAVNALVALINYYNKKKIWGLVKLIYFSGRTRIQIRCGSKSFYCIFYKLNCLIVEIPYSNSFLLDKLSDSDPKAFEAIYFRYWQPLLKAADKRLGNTHQSEDIVQNVFMGLWNKRESLKVLNLEAYLFTAVRYEVLNFITRSKRTLYFHGLLEEIMDSGTADAKILTDEMMELVLAYAQTLPLKRRCIFMEHLQTNASTKEIANVLQVSQKTVQNQLRTSLNGLFARINLIIFIILGCLLQS